MGIISQILAFLKEKGKIIREGAKLFTKFSPLPTRLAPNLKKSQLSPTDDAYIKAVIKQELASALQNIQKKGAGGRRARRVPSKSKGGANVCNVAMTCPSTRTQPSSQ